MRQTVHSGQRLGSPHFLHMALFGVSLGRHSSAVFRIQMRGLTFLRGEKPAERWRILCENAATERDHNKLLKLTEEVNRLIVCSTRRSNDSSSSKAQTLPGLLKNGPGRDEAPGPLAALTFLCRLLNEGQYLRFAL